MTWQEDCGGWSCELDVNGTPAILFKADAPMNLSGERLRYFLERAGRVISVCVLVYDDMDLALGDARLKAGGGHGGHNEVYSVMREVEPDALVKLRVGGRVPGRDRLARDLALRRFSRKDRALVDRGISTALTELAAYLQGSE